MRILFLGDIVGRAARNAVIDVLPGLRTELAADFIVINGENAAGGFGITPQIADDLFAAGGDVVTTGNHAFDKAEIATYIAHQPKLIRPANMNPAFPGAGEVIVQNKDGKRLGGGFKNSLLIDYEKSTPLIDGPNNRGFDESFVTPNCPCLPLVRRPRLIAVFCI